MPTHPRIRLLLPFLAALLALTTLALRPAAAKTLTVAYAGSMGVVMDRALGPAFATAHHVVYQGIGQGAWGLARLLAGKRLRADVFVAVTPGPMRFLIERGLVERAVPIASTQMVIAYSPRSPHAAEFAAAAQGKLPWYRILEQPGVRFGRTDPRVDPQGRNIIFTLLLAEKFYRQPDLARKILGAYLNPRQIFTEASLLSRLQAGQIDAASGYLSAVISHHLPYIRLPDAINLSDPKALATHADKVQFSLAVPDGQLHTYRPEPLVFYAAVLRNAPHPHLAQAFVAYLQGPEAQNLLARHGYGKPRGAPLANAAR